MYWTWTQGALALPKASTPWCTSAKSADGPSRRPTTSCPTSKGRRPTGRTPSGLCPQKRSWRELLIWDSNSVLVHSSSTPLSGWRLRSSRTYQVIIVICLSHIVTHGHFCWVIHYQWQPFITAIWFLKLTLHIFLTYDFQLEKVKLIWLLLLFFIFRPPLLSQLSDTSRTLHLDQGLWVWGLQCQHLTSISTGCHRNHLQDEEPVPPKHW